jgi:transposase-like protein
MGPLAATLSAARKEAHEGVRDPFTLSASGEAAVGDCDVRSEARHQAREPSVRARAQDHPALARRLARRRPHGVSAEVSQGTREPACGRPRQLDQSRPQGAPIRSASDRIWLRRVHKRHVRLATIQRTFKRLGKPRLPRHRKRVPRPRQLKLFEKPEPGASVQVDVKVVKIAGRKTFQYTAIDDCTRYRVLRLYRRQNQWSSLDFLAELRRGFPFPIRQLQSDNGPEFPLAFALTVQEAGIRHRCIKPRMPEQNGKVERSHRVDNEEFWRRQQFATFEAASTALRGWERTYNVDRFSMALAGETPAEKLARLLPAFQVA